jgi:MFS transporter, OFA family, oxalate/formate antiporter
MPLESGRGNGLHHGYWIILFSFLASFVYSGCCIYSFGLFVLPLQETFGWNRASIMLANTVSIVVRGLCSVLVGRLSDRYDNKWILICGAVVAGAGQILLGTATTLPQFVLYFALAGFGFAGIGFIPVTALIFRWFRKYRGRALGISGLGVGLGGFAVAPVIGGLVIPGLGWRAAFMLMGVFTIVVVVMPALLTLRGHPEEMGLLPDGGWAPEGGVLGPERPAAVLGGLTLQQALRTRAFWLAVVSCAAFGIPMNAILQNHVAHLQDLSFPLALVVGAMGGMGLANAAGKVGFGALCDAVKPKNALALGLGIQFVAVVILLGIRPSSSAFVVWLYALTMGLGLGSWVPTMTMTTSSTFGTLAYGSIFGTISLINTMGNAVGPLFAGWVYDTTHGYFIAFIVFLALYAIAAVTALLIKRPSWEPVAATGAVPADGEALPLP